MPSLINLPYLANAQAALASLQGLPMPVLLESRDSSDTAVDLLTAAPSALLQGSWQADGPAFTLHRQGRSEAVADPLAMANRLLSGRIRHPDLPIPFQGGLIGWLGYEFGLPLQKLPARPPGPDDLPDLWLAQCPWVVVTDHRLGKSWLVADRPLAADERHDLCHRLQQAASAPVHSRPAPRPDTGSSAFTASLDSHAYAAAFAAVHNYIQAGDCYQVNLSVHYQRPWQGDDLALYRALTDDQPAPFSAYLAPTPASRILSLSPERFLQVTDGQVQTCPIKGTRPRGRTAAEDRQLVLDLASSGKDRAENLMIVDLLRNDLGRVCSSGSIRVPQLFQTLSLARVHHLVSTVTGRLAPGKTALDLLAAAFPGGSITGAPKRRAMQVIGELEPHRRGVYCGSVLWLDHCGDMDSNIAIRTLVRNGGQLSAWGGGGVVADSDCASEAAEIQAKIGSLLAQANAASTLSRSAS